MASAVQTEKQQTGIANARVADAETVDAGKKRRRRPTLEAVRFPPFLTPASPPVSSSSLPRSLAEPSFLDYCRYWANRAGKPVAEIAKEGKVSEEAINVSLQRVLSDNERYSPLSTGIETRRLYIRSLPQIQSAVAEALNATRLEGKEVIIFNRETGKAEITKEPVERPDHDIRLRAIDGVRTLLSVVQPRDPAVQITTNAQTNILNQAALPAGTGQGGLTSPEAVIRQIVSQRQHTLTSGASAGQPLTIESTKEDKEEAMPRVRAGELDEDELVEEVEPDEEDTKGMDDDDDAESMLADEEDEDEEDTP
jgi:hypothetical protein